MMINLGFQRLFSSLSVSFQTYVELRCKESVPADMKSV